MRENSVVCAPPVEGVMGSLHVHAVGHPLLPDGVRAIRVYVHNVDGPRTGIVFMAEPVRPRLGIFCPSTGLLPTASV